MTVEVAGMVALNGNMRTPEGADSILDVMCRGGGGGGSVTVKNSSMPEMSEDMGLCEAVTPDGDSSKEDDEDDEEKIVPSKNMVEIEMRNSKGVGTTKKFEEHETTMILSGMDLVSISFRGLSQLQPSCLTELSLAANRLTTIDLTPFSTCVNLEAIMLNGNQLKKVDLNPLANCTKLQRLWLHNNQLTEVDTSVMCHFTSLQSLCLENNNISTTLNLAPLSKCRVLRSLRFGGNPSTGDLDVTPLLACKTLSSFDAPSALRLSAYTDSLTDSPSLPPALRRKNFSVTWKERNTSNRTGNVTDGEKLNALAIGFQSRHLNSLSLVLTTSRALSIVCYDEKKNVISPEFMKHFSVVLVHPTMEAKLQELRIANRQIPMVVIGNGATYSDAASRCLRRGARCFIPEPLTDRTAMSIRSLAQQYARTQVQSGNKFITTESKEVKNQEPEKKICFAELRVDYLSRNGVVSASPRQRLEESALGMMVQRRKDALYHAMITWHRLKSGESITSGISKDVLLGYFNERLKTFDLESRLFNILCQPGDNYVTMDSIKLLVHRLLKSRVGGFALMQAGGIDDGFMEQSVDIAASIVFYGISGSFSPLRQSKLRKAELCKTFISAESGVFKGFASALRPDRFNKVRLAVKKAGKGDKLSLPDVVFFNGEERLLVPYAVRKLFSIYSDKSSQMSVREFTRFFLATSDPSTVAATKYLFPALDDDMDGLITRHDLAMLYREKDHGVDFGSLWSSLHDLFSGEDNSHRSHCVSSGDIIALGAKDRYVTSVIAGRSNNALRKGHLLRRRPHSEEHKIY